MKTNDSKVYDELSNEDKNRWKILDSYFRLKDSVPSFGGKKLVQNNKTTEKIIDDLANMCELSADLVVKYMLDNGFGLENLDDGTVSWQIWDIEKGQF